MPQGMSPFQQWFWNLAQSQLMGQQEQQDLPAPPSTTASGGDGASPVGSQGRQTPPNPPVVNPMTPIMLPTITGQPIGADWLSPTPGSHVMSTDPGISGPTFFQNYSPDIPVGTGTVPDIGNPYPQAATTPVDPANIGPGTNTYLQDMYQGMDINLLQNMMQRLYSEGLLFGGQTPSSVMGQPSSQADISAESLPFTEPSALPGTSPAPATPDPTVAPGETPYQFPSQYPSAPAPYQPPAGIFDNPFGTTTQTQGYQSPGQIFQDLMGGTQLSSGIGPGSGFSPTGNLIWSDAEQAWVPATSASLAAQPAGDTATGTIDTTGAAAPGEPDQSAPPAGFQALGLDPTQLPGAPGTVYGVGSPGIPDAQGNIIPGTAISPQDAANMYNFGPATGVPGPGLFQNIGQGISNVAGNVGNFLGNIGNFFSSTGPGGYQPPPGTFQGETGPLNEAVTASLDPTSGAPTTIPQGLYSGLGNPVQPVGGINVGNLGGGGGYIGGGLGNAIADTLLRHMLETGQIQAPSVPNVAAQNFFAQAFRNAAVPGLAPVTTEQVGQQIPASMLNAIRNYLTSRGEARQRGDWSGQGPGGAGRPITSPR